MQDFEMQLALPSSSKDRTGLARTVRVFEVKSVKTIGLLHGFESPGDVEQMREHIKAALLNQWPDGNEETSVFGAVRQVLNQALFKGAPCAVLLDGSFHVIMLLRRRASQSDDSDSRYWIAKLHVAHYSDCDEHNQKPSVLKYVDMVLKVRLPCL
jgi:hypothetical protein